MYICQSATSYSPPHPHPSPPGGFSFTPHLRYVICGDADPSIFVSHASFPRKPLRKRLLDVVWDVSWVFDECPVGVMEYCCQNIESERQRSAFFDFEFHILFPPKTQRRNQRRTQENLLFICKEKDNARRRCSKFTLCVYGFAVLLKLRFVRSNEF